MDTPVSTMPETDWLTGLASRAAFVRLVTQVDRDRDPAAMAVIEIGDIGAVNHQLDYDAGDDLLGAIGRALGDHRSVVTTVARLGGAQFAVLGVGQPDDELRSWAAGLMASIDAAIARWTFSQVDFLGGCPIRPQVRVGVAAGTTGRIWQSAEAAVELARTEPPGAIVVHDTADPRVAALTERRRAEERLTTALSTDAVTVGGRAIEVLCEAAPEWRWLRLGARPPGEPGGGLVEAETLTVGPGRRLERWLLDRAGQVLAEGGGQLRVTVPVAQRVGGGEGAAERLVAALERWRVPPSRMLFEVAESTLLAAGAAGRGFVHRLDRAGSGVVVTGHQGGWQARCATDGLPIVHLQPDARLVAQAPTDPAAAAILSAISAIATADERTLIAPPTGLANGVLAELGFTFRQRSTTETL